VYQRDSAKYCSMIFRSFIHGDIKETALVMRALTLP
jgi:hypothetical protein